MDLQPPVQNTAIPLAEPLPAAVEAVLWRGSELRPPPATVHRSSWAALDAELPGGGWPAMALTELLVCQPGVLEWRLLAPAIRPIVAAGGEVAVVGPPRPPALAGLVQDGLEPDRFWRYQVDEPARRHRIAVAAYLRITGLPLRLHAPHPWASPQSRRSRPRPRRGLFKL